MKVRLLFGFYNLVAKNRKNFKYEGFFCLV